MALSDTLKLIITGDGSSASAAFKKTAVDAKKSLGEAEGGAGKATAALGMMGPAVVAAGAAVVAFGIKSVSTYQDVGSEVRKLQMYTGGTAEETSKLRFAAIQTGTGIDQLALALGKMSKVLIGTPATFAKYQIATEDSAGKALSLHEVLLNTAEDFKNMPNGAEKTAEALALFGKAGAGMIPFLNRGRQGIADLEAQTGDYGELLSGKNLQDIKANKEAQREFQAALQGIQLTIGKELLPEITSLTEEVTSALKPINSIVETIQNWDEKTHGLFTMMKDLMTLDFFDYGKRMGDLFGSLFSDGKKAEVSTEDFAKAQGISTDAAQHWLDAQKAAGTTYTDVGKAQKDYTADVIAGADSTKEAEVNTHAYTDEVVGAHKALDDATKALDTATKALTGWFDEMSGNLDTEAAYQGAVDDLTQSIKDNGATTDLNTDKGRNNLKAIEDVKKSILDKASATARDTGSVQQGIDVANLYVSSLEDQLHKLGFTKQAAADYIAQLNLTPKDVKTAFDASGLDYAMGAATFYSQQLDKLNGRTVTSVIIAQYRAEGVRPGAINAETQAYGGPVHRGQSYIVGDRRGMDTAELFTPSSDGVITPNANGATGGGSPVIHVWVGGREVEAVVTEAQRTDARGRR